MTLYSRTLFYASILLIVASILYGVYMYLFSPIPGDNLNVRSSVFRKTEPVKTQLETTIGKDVKITKTGAFSFLFTMTEIPEYKDSDPILFPILTFYKSSDNTGTRGPASISAMVNRLTSEVSIGFYNSQGDLYTVPISTGPLKRKISVFVRMIEPKDNDTFLANIYLNGEFIASRGIPLEFSPVGGNSHTIVSGSRNGIEGIIQTIRSWDDAREITEDDIKRVSEDPFYY